MASTNFLFRFGNPARMHNVILRRFGDIFAIFDYGATASPVEPWPIIGGGWDSGTIAGSVTSNNSYDYGSITQQAENV